MKSSRGVFICHASADKNRIVRTLAADLESMGVDVWFDEWELGPGDSLRSRIASGISGCAYFLVVVSSRSLKSSWVQWELDSGTIRQIEGSATVVPLVFGQL